MAKALRKEIRTFPIEELRAAEDDTGRTLAGYPVIFNSLSEPMWGFRETVRPGAFTKTLQERDILSLWNHDSSKPLGRTGNKTLTLAEDDRGLRYDNTVPETTWGKDAYISVQRGDVKGMSFAFSVVKEVWHEETEDGEPLREILEARLYEVSPVTFPAYPMTEVEARAIMDDNGVTCRDTSNPDESQTDTTSEPIPSADHSEADAIAIRHRRRRARLTLLESE
jgi:HK97 family phage prohead protease